MVAGRFSYRPGDGMVRKFVAFRLSGRASRGSSGDEVARRPEPGQPRFQAVSVRLRRHMPVQFLRQDFFGEREKINFRIFLVGSLHAFLISSRWQGGKPSGCEQHVHNLSAPKTQHDTTTSPRETTRRKNRTADQCAGAKLVISRAIAFFPRILPIFCFIRRVLAREFGLIFSEGDEGCGPFFSLVAPRIAGWLTLLTTPYGREVHSDMVETCDSPQTTGQCGHLQALVLRGQARSGDRRCAHPARPEQHLSVLD